MKQLDKIYEYAITIVSKKAREEPPQLKLYHARSRLAR